jgi:hypothetical protein
VTLLSGGGGGSDGESIEDPKGKYVSSDPDKEASGGEWGEDATTVGQRHTDGSRGGGGGFGGGKVSNAHRLLMHICTHKIQTLHLESSDT